MRHKHYIINFQFKIIHRLLACGYNLKTWKIKTKDECVTCNQHMDTIEHFMIYCEPVKTFWNQLLNWWTNPIKVIFRQDTYGILFGIPNDEKDPIISQFNFILLMARFYIYKSKKADGKLEMYIFLMECKNTYVWKKYNGWQ